MKSIDLNAIDPADLAPIPEVPESFGPRNAEEKRILERIQEALAGDFSPMDDAFFAEIDTVISSPS